MNFSIAERLQNVRQRIQNSTISAGRSEDSVCLLAVSKKHRAAALRDMVQAGVLNFGESYVQEALAKQEELQNLISAAQWQLLTWHFIGPLQSNKTRLVAERFDWVHSLERAKIAVRLNEQRPVEMAPLNVCIQVNIDAEESKSGIALHQLPELAKEIVALPALVLRGVMAIPVRSKDEVVLRQSFTRLQQAYEDLRQQYSTVDTLSMGMSDDLDLAIQCGSTMVRVGTALFGGRG